MVTSRLHPLVIYILIYIKIMSIAMKKTLIIGSLGMLGQKFLKIFPQAVGLDIKDLDITNKAQVENKIKIN